ncbi:MAG: Na(+)/H(+) antiporter subunit D [Candidatus Loosdrechtia sp.]|uniref:Na(+)/H(+) antiporter subunit D n=1 Tax=Candidatus Loosdrechtia sp. TaxID=3101272 RepID=UPI003A752E22|nr:MAG: Na(+)/H(+) antiporter subunit D [Candidatus Jettenia sp. AMX2]
MTAVHPSVILIPGGVVSLFLPPRWRGWFGVFIPVLALVTVFCLKTGKSWYVSFLGQFDLILLQVDSLALLFAGTYAVMALVNMSYSFHVRQKTELGMALIYTGASMGVIFSGDWLTLIAFWELMAVSSSVIVWLGGRNRSAKAALRYIMVHFFGGNLLLAGIVLKVSSGNPYIESLTGTGDAAFWLILAGVLINAAAPPLHSWLTDAYPEASPTATVWMNMLTTKIGVYMLIKVFPGTDVLIIVGIVAALYGVIYAILENNTRRLLSYHIISQVGLMTAAVGIGSDLALNGAAALAIGNILYKSLLFMSIGAVVYQTGKEKLTELGGLSSEMPAVTAFFAIGALAISGFPLLNGFISKPLITTAASYHGFPVVEHLLYLASAGTFLSIPLKMGYFAFFRTFDKRKKLLNERLPAGMYMAMGTVAGLCFLFGLHPHLLYQQLPFSFSYQPYVWKKVGSELLFFTGISSGFWLMLSNMKTREVTTFDTDWFYRKPLVVMVDAVARNLNLLGAFVNLKAAGVLKWSVPFWDNPFRWIDIFNREQAPAKFDPDFYRTSMGWLIVPSIFVFIVTILYIYK